MFLFKMDDRFSKLTVRTAFGFFIYDGKAGRGGGERKRGQTRVAPTVSGWKAR